MGRSRIHLDTDIGGDTDDVCALAMLLGSKDADVVAVTTCIESGGRRAARARRVLAMAGREEISVAAGGNRLFDGSAHEYGLQDSRYWPDEPEHVAPDEDGAAERMLGESIDSGATLLAIGPLTNLARLEERLPGTLRHANVVVMGGYGEAPAAGYPQWGPAMNFNFEADAPAARKVFDACDPLVIPLHVCLGVAVRARDLPALRAGGPLANLVARQSELHGRDNDMDSLAAANPRLASDILNFQWDPVACAAALRWDCVTIEVRPLELTEGNGGMVFVSRPGDPIRRVVTAIDAEAFTARWLECVVRV